MTHERQLGQLEIEVTVLEGIFGGQYFITIQMGSISVIFLIFRLEYHVMKEMGQLEELSFPDGRHVSVITTLDGLLNGHHRHQNGHHPSHNGHQNGHDRQDHHHDQSRDNIENNSTGTGFDTGDGDSGVEQIQNSRVSPDNIQNLNHQEIKQENYYAESGYTSSINSVCH